MQENILVQIILLNGKINQIHPHFFYFTVDARSNLSKKSHFLTYINLIYMNNFYESNIDLINQFLEDSYENDYETQ